MILRRPVSIVSRLRRMAAVLLTAALPMAPAAAARITIAIPDLPAFATTLVAEARGYFVDEGLDLHVIHGVNGKRCLKHLTDGDAQYAAVADTPIVLSILAGGRFDILASLATTSRENHFVVRADRAINGVSDLRGKRIGVVKGTSGHYFADTFLLFHGIAPSEVTIVPLDPADAAAALVRGDVDAAGFYQPHGYKAMAALGAEARVLPNPKMFTMAVNLVGITRAGGGRDEDAVKLIKAFRRANEFILAEPAKAQAIIAARLNYDPAMLAAIWPDFDFEMSLAQPLVTTLEAQTRWAMREGLAPRATMPDYLDAIRLDPLQSVDRKLVSIVK